MHTAALQLGMLRKIDKTGRRDGAGASTLPNTIKVAAITPYGYTLSQGSAEAALLP